MANKILFHIGDIHSKLCDYYNYGFSRFLEWLDKTIPNSHKEDTEIFLTGDVLDKTRGDYAQVGPLLDLISLLNKKASNVYTILGNHDWGIKDSKVISNKIFLEKLGIKVIDTIQVYNTKLGFKVLCLPWTPNLKLPEVNEIITENFNNQSYDSIVAHWEIQPLFSDDYLDISNINAYCKAVGHIHTKSNHEYYIGSILPNSSAENKKEEDLSVIRSLIKSDSGTSIVRDISIPSFVNIQYTKIDQLENLYNLVKRDDVFYKVAYNIESTSRSSIQEFLKNNNVNTYSLIATSKDQKDLNLSLETEAETDILIGINKQTILAKCKEILNISDEDYAVMLERINRI